MRIHADITANRVIAAVEDQHSTLANPGFCNACGAEADGCEPDARNLECEICGEAQVFGAEEFFFSMQ